MEQNKLTKNEIARVFTMYWGRETGSPPPYDRVTGMMIDFVSTGMMTIELLLTPLAAISDTDALEYGKIISSDEKEFEEFKKELPEGKVFLMEIISSIAPDGLAENQVPPLKIFFGYQYLIQKGYDVPLFFVPNHWANGRSAIELGIAIDKTALTD